MMIVLLETCLGLDELYTGITEPRYVLEVYMYPYTASSCSCVVVFILIDRLLV